MDISSKIAQGLLSIGAVFLRPQEPFIWASGIKSPIYCDNRLILTAPAVRDTVYPLLSEHARIHLTDPVNLRDAHNFMARCRFVMTDSGGIQEEAPSLGKPVLVMRNTTERPEGIAAGTLKLVGTEEEPIYQNIKQLLDDPGAYKRMSQASNPLRRWLCQRPHCGYTQKGTAVNGHKPSVSERNSYEQLYQ